jgi:choline dehydrogenase-like flavoprotein
MGTNQEYDAIVVGSGPGGATVAKELTARNKKVLVLEEGRNEPITGKKIQVIRDLGIPGKNFLLTYGGLACVRATAVGGTSVYYYATCFDPPVEVFKKYGIDISREVAEAYKEVPSTPLKDELIGPKARRIMESARSLGMDWKKMNKFIHQDKCLPDCDLCQMGCPHGAKWTAREYLDQAIEKGALLIDRATVEMILTDGKRAVGVEFTRKGRKYKAYAENIILAAGGIGSPVLMRKIGVARAGYDYLYDPFVCVMGSVKDVKGHKELPMATGMHFPDRGFVMTDLTFPSILYMGLTAEVLRFDRIFSHSHVLGIMIKVKDDLGGRLTDSGGIRKRLQKQDREKLADGQGVAERILRNAGAKSVFKSWYIAAHPGGTVRINDLVDSNLKTGFDNLYVCDNSVMPDPLGLPPTMTIICLGKRLAKHLAAGRTARKLEAVKPAGAR